MEKLYGVGVGGIQFDGVSQVDDGLGSRTFLRQQLAQLRMRGGEVWLGVDRRAKRGQRAGFVVLGEQTLREVVVRLGEVGFDLDGAAETGGGFGMLLLQQHCRAEIEMRL